MSAPLMRQWLSRCIARLEAMPPSPVRNESLRILNEELQRYPASNVIPLRGRA